MGRPAVDPVLAEIFLAELAERLTAERDRAVQKGFTDVTVYDPLFVTATREPSAESGRAARLHVVYSFGERDVLDRNHRLGECRISFAVPPDPIASGFPCPIWYRSRRNAVTPKCR